MPYRRLPNTNAARLKALQQIVKMGDVLTDLKDLAFSCRLLEESRAALVKYRKMLSEYSQCTDTRVNANKNYQEKLKKARLYISHFIQVLNMCIQRGEIKPDMKVLYELDVESFSVPDLTSEDKIYEWGRKIIDGEQARIQRGGAPIYNPTIAKVRVHYDIFSEGYNNQKVLQNNTTRAVSSVIELNKEVDEVILQVWNEVEARFQELPLEERVEKCKEYGVVYYYRRNERKKMQNNV